MGLLTAADVVLETARICEFIASSVAPAGRACVAVSGGLDSDVVARLTARAAGAGHLKLFVALQDDIDPAHLSNARELARELRVPLVEVDLRGLPADFMRRLAQADPSEGFRPDGLIDPARAKCSLRTPVLSTYQDRGYVIVGTSNRTEIDTGFFLPFGDALCHIAPIAHLYKSEVRLLARHVGSARAVLEQPPSAGFWLGETDIEDLSFWLFNGGPVGREREFSGAEVEQVQAIASRLTIDAIDQVLYGMRGGADDADLAGRTPLPRELIARFRTLVARAAERKRPARSFALPRLEGAGNE